MSRWRHFAFALAMMFALIAHATAQQTRPSAWKTVSEHWYVLELNGGKIGWSSSHTESNDHQFRTSQQSHLTMARGETVKAIDQKEVFIETADGAPVSIQYTQATGTQPIHIEWQFSKNTVKQSTRESGRTTTKDIPIPEGSWLMPEAVRRFTQEAIRTHKTSLTYRTIDPESNLKVIETSSVRQGESTLQVNGKSIPLTVWKTTSNDWPGVERMDKFDDSGDMVWEEVPTGLGKIITILSDKQHATLESGPPQEIVMRTFVQPDKPISNPLQSTRARFKLTVKDGQMPTLPSAGAQKFEKGSDDKNATVTVDVESEQPAAEADLTDKEYLQDSPMVDFTDPRVKSLAETGIKGAGAGLSNRAEALRRFVHQFIQTKNLDTAFASASETARTKSGDCSEHAVLLCALLRASDIPARVASGMIYAESFMGKQGIFGWHMWTQALIDGRWVDFDATLTRRFNAVHILTGVSSLRDGLGASDMAAMLQLIGNVEISVLDVRYDSRDSAGDGVHE